MLYSEWWFFFFFQAEDGIRDIGVTGVQTCALPILAFLRDQPWITEQHSCCQADLPGICCVPAPTLQNPSQLFYWGNSIQRSEERRVGKECRSRWSPYH